MSYREIWFKFGQVTSSWIKDFNALNNERMKSTIYKYKSTTQSMCINQQNQRGK